MLEPLGLPCAAGLACVGVCAATANQLYQTCELGGAGCDETAGLACNAATGTCQSLRLAENGEACGIVDSQFVTCFAGSCVRGVCVASVPLGGACELSGAACMSNTRCVIPDGATVGTCQVPGTGACQ